MSPKRNKALVLLSGGLDSALALKLLQKQGVPVEAVCFESCFFDAFQAKKSAKALKAALKLDDANSEQIQKTMEELSQSSHKLAEQVYKAQTQEQQAGAAGAAGAQGPDAGAQTQGDAQADDKPKEEDVVDAEYKEENSK